MASQESVAPAGKSGGLTGRGVLIVVVLAVLALFIVQNTGSVRVHVLFIDFDMSVWLLIVISFVLGMVLDNSVMGLFRKLRRKSK